MTSNSAACRNLDIVGKNDRLAREIKISGEGEPSPSINPDLRLTHRSIRMSIGSEIRVLFGHNAVTIGCEIRV